MSFWRTLVSWKLASTPPASDDTGTKTLLNAIEVVVEQNERLIEERAQLVDHVMATQNVCRELVQMVSGAKGFNAETWEKAMSMIDPQSVSSLTDERLERIGRLMRDIGGVTRRKRPSLRIVEGG